MSKNSDPYGIRANNRAALAKNLADRDAREMRLAPEVVAYWTKLVQRAVPFVTPSARPCDYTPWIKALRRAQDIPQPPGRLSSADTYIERYLDLMIFAQHIDKPRWPTPRHDLIEFALCFLEADVMLFRSGHAKRHMIRRIQQAQLNAGQIDRVGALLRRAVTDGTGLEEFRAYKRLSAHLVINGHFPEWESWLRQQAEGALLTVDRANVGLWNMMMSAPELTEGDYIKLVHRRFWGRSKFGVRWPDMDRVVEAGAHIDEPKEQSCRNAYLMLEAILRRRGQL